MPQIVASDQGLYCESFSIIATSVGSKMELFKFKDKYDKELKFSNI